MPYSSSDWYIMGSWFCEGVAALIVFAVIVHFVMKRFRKNNDN